MIAAMAALLLLAPPPGCEAAAGAAAWSAERLAAEAERLAGEAAHSGPAAALAESAGALSRAAPEARQEAAARFAAALAHHCRLAAQPPGARMLTPADRAALDRLLAEPRFSRARPFPEQLRDWLLRLWDRLAELLGTEEAEQVASRGRSAFFAAAGLLAAALAILSLRRRRAQRAGPARPARAPAPAPPPPPPDAEAALASGDSLGAVRAALLAALSALERAGRLPDGRALTNREAASRLLASAPGAAASFEHLAAAFDRAVYGGRPPSTAEAAECAAASRRLVAEFMEAAP